MTQITQLENSTCYVIKGCRKGYMGQGSPPVNLDQSNEKLGGHSTGLQLICEPTPVNGDGPSVSRMEPIMTTALPHAVCRKGPSGCVFGASSSFHTNCWVNLT